MIIVKVNGGLCNQIYFFATAYALSKEWNEELMIDCDVDGNAEWTYLLDEFQMPDYEKIIYPRRYHIGRDYVSLASGLREKAVIIDETYFEQVGEYLTISKEKFTSEFPGKDIYLKGAFLIRQMFTKYLSDLRNIFNLKVSSPLVCQFEKSIEHITAVGVHIRRQGFSVLGDDNGMDFFMAAIVHMRQRYDNARFYVFSDELDYVKENLGTAEDIFYIDAMNGYRGDVEEFVCLTKCHHYILTRRSTYGRMAEILNPSEEKTSVLYGANTWNDSEERFIFLSEEKVRRLRGLFDKKECGRKAMAEAWTGKSGNELWRELIRISLDSEAVTATDRRAILIQKAKLYAEQGMYGQAVHLCRLLEDQYGEDSNQFHELYGDLLELYGHLRDAVVEYIRAAKEKTIEKALFRDPDFMQYKELLKTGHGKHYVIVQCDAYNSQYLSQMQMIGLILGRMGNHVSFVFKREIKEVQDGQLNVVMMEWNRKVDYKWLDLILKEGFSIGRFYYGYSCYDYASVIENVEERLREIAKEYPQEESIIVSRDPKMFSDEIPFRKVFVDFSDPFDEAYIKAEVGAANIDDMYRYADLVVTRDKNYKGNGQKVICIEDDLLDTEQKGTMKIPCCEPTVYTEDYLETALKIALNSI